MTMQPRTGDVSARSASFTTAWYHSAKFSRRVIGSALGMVYILLLGRRGGPEADPMAAGHGAV
jgi:hypothetical protein